MSFTKEEQEILSEALEMYALKYNSLKTKDGKLSIREEVSKAINIMQKIINAESK